MRISFESNRFGHYNVYNVANDESLAYYQTDYDFPSLAYTFGMKQGKNPDNVTREIARAIRFLDNNEGKVITSCDFEEVAQ